MALTTQFLVVFALALPVACVSWTVTHEEVFREPRDWCLKKSRAARGLPMRKFFFVFTCEYCFSHYVTVGALALSRFTFVVPGWPGCLFAGFAIVWIANVYMGLFGRLRLDIKHERQDIAVEEALLKATKTNRPAALRASRLPHAR
jgi:hypothetical protein